MGGGGIGVQCPNIKKSPSARYSIQKKYNTCINIKRIQPEYISHCLASRRLDEMVIASPPDPSAST